MIYALGAITVSVAIIFSYFIMGTENYNWYWYEHRYFQTYANIATLIGFAVLISGYAGYMWFGRIERRNNSSSESDK